jgi:purine-binding chemotaxis protein CheW
LFNKAKEEQKTKSRFDKIIIFRVDKSLYGLEITDIQGIETLPEITPLGLPNIPDFIAGIFNLRGDVVPLIDARKKLTVKTKNTENLELQRVLVVEINHAKVGIIVDEVREIYEFVDGDLHPLPVGIGGLKSEFVRAIGKIDNRLIIIMDINFFITAEGKFQLDFMDDLESYLKSE